MSSTLIFLSHTDESCKDETRVCGYIFEDRKIYFLNYKIGIKLKSLQIVITNASYKEI